MEKVKPSIATPKEFKFCTNGRWAWEEVEGIQIYIEAKRKYVTFSPRRVAIARAIREFWILNRGHQFTWEETLRTVSSSFLRGVGHLKHDDYDAGKMIIRELGPIHMSGKGETFVYASTRGPAAVAGFVVEVTDARDYERRNHQMFRVMEHRLAAATVIPAGEEFAVPVRKSSIRTRTLNGTR